MKNLLLILFSLFSLVSFSQPDEYYRSVDWKFYPENVTLLTDSTFQIDAIPYDYNDPGSINRTVGNYVIDFVGHRYEVIDSTSTTITVLDIYHTGQAPQTSQIARCYRSVQKEGGKPAKFIGSVDYSPLDESARWKLNGADNYLLWNQLGQPFDTLTFNTNYVSTTPLQKGTLIWNDTDGTLDLNMGLVTQQIGQELPLPAYNNTGVIIPEGTPVYISGRQGHLPEITPCRSDLDATSSTFGVTTTTFGTVGSAKNGFVTPFGYVRQLKTNYTGSGNWGTTWAANDKLYVSKTVAGQLTNIKPSVPHHSDIVATVAIVGAEGIGSILVLNQKHQTLEELTDVNGTPLTISGQFPVWDNVNKYFDFNYNINGYQPLHGIYNKSQSTLSYNNGTRTVSVTPTSTTWRYYLEGKEYDKTTITSTHPATTGMHYLYYDSGNNLQFSTTPFSIATDVLIATTYYNSTLSTGILLDERHSASRNRLAHQEFHDIVGAYKVSGFGISDYTLQPASPTDADNTFSLTSGVIADEDIRHMLSALADNGPYKVFYKSGASGVWTWESNNVPYTWGATYVEWNQWTGATWQLTQASANNFLNMWVGKIGAVEGQYQTAIIVDQDEHAIAADAMLQKLGDMDFSGFPLPEFAVIYKVTLQTGAGYTTTGKCRIYAVTEEVKSFGGSGGGAAATTAHNSLTGIDGGEIGYYGHLNNIEKARIMNFQDSVQSNEGQNLSLSGNTLSLTNDATSVDLSGYNNDRSVNVCILGSSATAAYLGYNGMDYYLITEDDKNNGDAVTNLAVPGNTINDQLAAWNANPNKLLYDAIVLQIGGNDVSNYLDTTSVVIARYQTLVNQINATKKENAIIIVGKINPFKQRLYDSYAPEWAAIYYQRWLDLNQAIMGYGPTPITGVDVRVALNSDLLNDGSDNLISGYDYGDKIHYNNTAREIVANVYRKTLKHYGFLKFEDKSFGSTMNASTNVNYNQIISKQGVQLGLDNLRYGLIGTSGNPLISSGTNSMPVWANLGTGYLPYKSATSLVNSPILTDGIRLSIGTTINTAVTINIKNAGEYGFIVNSTAALGASSGGLAGLFTNNIPNATGQRLGFLLFGSRNTEASFYNSAGIAAYSAGTWTAGTSHPSYLQFEVTPSGSTTRSSAMRINSNNTVSINNTNSTYGLDVTGTVNTSNFYRIGTIETKLDKFKVGSLGTAGQIPIANSSITDFTWTTPTTAHITSSTDKRYLTDAQLSVVGNTSGTNTGDNSPNTLYSGLVSNATHTGDVTGSTALTLATVNSNIGTFNNITINAKGLATAGSNVSYLTTIIDTMSITIAISDESTLLTTGFAKRTFRMPFSCTLTKVRASVTTNPTGANLIFDINENGGSMLSTKLSIDVSEKTSKTAATQPVISDSSIADDSEITIDINQIGSIVAGSGAKITLYYIKN